MYQALYRKYRPKSFCDVYGQDHIVSTLKNEINENRISHAYLFTGTRGTGKTSCAKILAKAVNCESSNDGDPCNECVMCKGLDSGTIYDVVEIDAASNNGVDNIRELREEANYTPTRGKYRVYIIDEVHMLSIGAFNALLKTLEEPPAHVIFILATTEVHKLPATILSRCQRFDFKRIQPEDMTKRLKQVCELESIVIDDDAATLIARLADGALRDGLSILDQCASRSNCVNSELVAQVAGLAGMDIFHGLITCTINKDSSTAIDVLADLYQNSYDLERLCGEMINYFRNLLIIKSVKKCRELIICTDNDFIQMENFCESFTVEQIIFALDLFQAAYSKIKSGISARIEVEMSFIKLCEPKLDESNQALLERISQLEKMIKAGVRPDTKSVASDKVIPDTDIKAKVDIPDEEQPITISQESNDQKVEIANEDASINQRADAIANGKFEQWAEFMDIIHKKDIALFGVLNGASARIINDHFVIESANPMVKDFIKVQTHIKAIRQAVAEITGMNLKLGIAKIPNENSEKKDLLEDLINKAQNNITINYE